MHFLLCFPNQNGKISKMLKFLITGNSSSSIVLLHVYCHVVSAEYKIPVSCHFSSSLDLWNQTTKCPIFTPAGSHRDCQPPPVISYFLCLLLVEFCSVTVNITNLLLIVSWKCKSSLLLSLFEKLRKLMKRKQNQTKKHCAF